MVQGLSDAEITLLREQMDRTSIREQIERHLHGLDSRRFEDVFMKAYTDDATFSAFSGEHVTRGYDENLASARRVEMSTSSVHAFGNTRIELDGDAASSETYIVAFLESLPPGLIMARGVRYRHRWRREADGWRCYDLSHEPFWQYEVAAVDPSGPPPHQRGRVDAGG
jgi:ketosteroid isomerase-like protein